MKERKNVQVHLATLLVLMFVVCLIWQANVFVRYVEFCHVKGWPFPILLILADI